jgi:hypothetical protein
VGCCPPGLWVRPRDHMESHRTAITAPSAIAAPTRSHFGDRQDTAYSGGWGYCITNHAIPGKQVNALSSQAWPIWSACPSARAKVVLSRSRIWWSVYFMTITPSGISSLHQRTVPGLYPLLYAADLEE